MKTVSGWHRLRAKGAPEAYTQPLMGHVAPLTAAGLVATWGRTDQIEGLIITSQDGTDQQTVIDALTTTRSP
ncbi:hypothetical protein OG339_47840 (plasmid) [Streptosporangium sp. NBC_01495]|uniref:hypothetical protein n=1 Tax=Streptosporangium sp. NBC_01495 TaxID=2903899 RepID=UPI002E2F203F|nr:hypothetical protein [Streptosporangium sp. NBC_01495]